MSQHTIRDVVPFAFIDPVALMTEARRMEHDELAKMACTVYLHDGPRDGARVETPLTMRSGQRVQPASIGPVLYYDSNDFTVASPNETLPTGRSTMPSTKEGWYVDTGLRAYPGLERVMQWEPAEEEPQVAAERQARLLARGGEQR